MNAPDRDSTTILDALATQDRALRIAMRAHEGQHRKSDPDLPYITHPIAVATIVATHGFSATTVAAAYLHDVLEDTAWSAEDLLAAGVEQCVLDIVRECSEAPKPLSWRERKRDLISRMRTCSREAAAVMCADKLHNASSTLPHILERGPKVGWSHLGSDPKSQLWWYTSCVEALRPHALPHHRLFEAVVQDLVEASQRTA